jgi:hypothetical protein
MANGRLLVFRGLVGVVPLESKLPSLPFHQKDSALTAFAEFLSNRQRDYSGGVDVDSR